MPRDVLLRCWHTARYPYPYPVEGDSVYCRRCNDYSIVASIMSEYRVRCGGCNLSRGYGRDLGNARIAATKHINKTQHTLSIWDGSEVLETIGPSEAQQELPLPGRKSVNAAHQARLKLLSNCDHPRSSQDGSA